MRDLGYAAKEKETEEHDVIDEAIQEEAEVRPLVYVLEIASDCSKGFHSLLDWSRHTISTQQCQGEEFEIKRLSRQGSIDRFR